MKFLATILFICLLAAQGKSQAPTNVLGDYIEARSGHVYTCGCLYSGEMVTAGKEAILVWRINRGSYQGTSLTGIKAAAVVVSDANLGTESAPRRTVLYLDGVTSEAQQRVLLALWRNAYSNVLGDIKAVHHAPVSFDLERDGANVSIPGVAQLRVRKAHLPEDAHQGSALWYGPFTALHDSSLATTLHYEYAGVDFQHQWTDLMPGIRGYMGGFALPSGL